MAHDAGRNIKAAGKSSGVSHMVLWKDLK